MIAPLTQLEKESARILEQLRKLETLPIRDVSKLLGKSPRWIRSNLPIIALGERSQRVRAVDVEEFLQRRTIRPNTQTNFQEPKALGNGSA